MLLCIDVGNTNITYGFYKNDELYCTFRNDTKEIINLNDLEDNFLMGINNYNIHKNEIEFAIICSVVPRIDNLLVEMFKDLIIEKYFVTYESPLDIDICLTDPTELGSDLLIGAYQTLNKYGGPAIIVDMGTASTVVVVSEKREFLGGQVLPGIITSYNNLFKDAALLVNTNIAIPETVIGKNTKECIQSGMVYGSSSMINGLVNLIKDELNNPSIKVIMTGGIASFICPYVNDCIYDDNLILDGLLDIYNKIVKKGWL